MNAMNEKPLDYFVTVNRTRAEGHWQDEPHHAEELVRIRVEGGNLRRLLHVCKARPHLAEFLLSEGFNGLVRDLTHSLGSETKSDTLKRKLTELRGSVQVNHPRSAESVE